MAELPLHDPSPGHPDAWHHVRSPGGYEWWQFDAEDAAGRYRIIAIFFDGFPFHPQYVRRYGLFHETPTQVRPPLPSEYRCVYFAVYDGDSLLSQFTHQYPPELFAASSDMPGVVIGPNRFEVTPDGAFRLHLTGVPWELTWQGPKLLAGEQLAADLVFRPLFPHRPHERAVLSREMTGSDHRWILANPRCAVEGTVRVGGDSRDGIPISVSFEGTGYHDHQYGLAPISPGLRRWMCGRAIANDRVYAFQIACAKDSSLPDEAHLVRGDAPGSTEVAASCSAIDWNARTPLGLAYPRQIAFGGQLKLTNPRVVDTTPFYLRLIYDASLDQDARTTTAFCQVVYPRRLTWPVIGGMIEKSISRGATPEGRS